MSTRRVLVAGGAGYIGSHTAVCLIEAGYSVTIADNFVNSSAESIARVRELTGASEVVLNVVNVDLCNASELDRMFVEHGPFVACIHFAGLKAVGESVLKPLLYYENNLLSTTNLLSSLDKHGCTAFVFSSSATVYGSAPVPISESVPTGVGITNPYGRTKYMIEEILKDFVESKAIAHKSGTLAGDSLPWRVTILRYFNPVGSHPSGRIGEDPNGIPNNLMPFVAQVAVGRRPHLTIFGDDYETADGTGVRDYVHVMDLARGHVAALAKMGCDRADVALMESPPITRIYNLGSGCGYSVLDMVRAMEKACGHSVPYQIGPRRQGDIGTCYADCSLANKELNWRAELTLDDMCRDLWNWQQQNPNGYPK